MKGIQKYIRHFGLGRESAIEERSSLSDFDSCHQHRMQTTLHSLRCFLVAGTMQSRFLSAYGSCEMMAYA